MVPEVEMPTVENIFCESLNLSWSNDIGMYLIQVLSISLFYMNDIARVASDISTPRYGTFEQWDNTFTIWYCV